ncbi:MAG: hypothetical protein ACT4QF_11085 [Sporichthyaceae bacterium]
MSTNRKLASAGIAASLCAALAVFGGGGVAGAADPSPLDPVLEALTPAAPPAGCDPNAPGSCDPASPSDPFSNPKARCPAGGEPAKTITASGNTFCADMYGGATGETWTFNNPDIAIHNVGTDDFEKNPAKFKSADVEMGKAGTFTMPAKKGSYTIICSYHPGSMTAKLTLQ